MRGNIRLYDNLIDFCRSVISRLRPAFVVITLILVFLAPFIANTGFQVAAILSFLTNLLLMIFDFKASLFSKIDEAKNSIDEIKITILNCNPLAFQHSVSLTDFSVRLPILIGTNVEGCLSSAYRESIDLTKLSKVRAYCDFLRTDRGKEYPPIVVCTGRSQGYVELLAQALGLTESRVEVPFIIEMGAALYYPSSKKTKSLLTEEEESLIANVRSILRQEQELKDIIFEPKSFIVTVNPSDTETVDDLFRKIASLLERRGLGDRVNIIRGNTAVDITPIRINKLSILHEVVTDYTGGKQGLESIVYIAESNGDKAIIDHVREAYCSESEATHEIEEKVRRKFGVNYILKAKDIDVFLAVLDKACGVKIL